MDIWQLEDSGDSGEMRKEDCTRPKPWNAYLRNLKFIME